MKHTGSSSYRPKTPNERKLTIPSALDVLGTNVLGEPVRVPGHTRIEIIFPHSRRQLKTVSLRTGAELNHFSESTLVAHPIEKHAPSRSSSATDGAKTSYAEARFRPMNPYPAGD